MKTLPSAALGRYLSQKPGVGNHTSPTTYVVNGADTVTPVDLGGLRQLLPQVREKAGLITDSARLVETVYHRNLLALRSHWATQGRPWPENP